MTFKKFIVFVICFIIIGEVIIRLTDYFSLFESNRVQKIEVGFDSSYELELLNSDKIDLTDSSLRILVIGDSYIHGGGIDPKDKFSNKLKNIIYNANSKYKYVYILDMSIPDANNLDNTETYFRYESRFNPQIIILGYHFNDINGSLETIEHDTTEMKSPEISGGQSKMMIRQITDLLYNSAILNYTMPKINNFMLSIGYIIPNSRLDNTLKYYSNNNFSWVKSKELLKGMSDHIAKKKSKLIVYHFTYTNLIEYPELFLESANQIERFFLSFDNVDYISGIRQFEGKQASDYFIYKHDGHPNALAHTFISEKVNEYIIKYTAYDRRTVLNSK